MAIAGNGVYAGERVVNFEIDCAEQTVAIVDEEALELAYGDTAELEVEAEGALTFSSSDADVVTVDSTGTLVARGLGQAELTIAAAETKNYLPGELRATVRVSAADLSEAQVSVAEQDFTYTGKAQEPAVTVSLREKELVRDVDYVATYEGNVDAGTAKVTVTGEGNYTGTASTSFGIEPMNLASDNVGASIAGQTYTGEPLTPLPTLTFAGEALAEGDDYSLGDYENNVEVGTARLTVWGEGNFAGTKVLTFEISEVEKTSINAAVVEIEPQEFQDVELEPVVVVTLNGEPLPSTVYEVSYGHCIGAGDYTVTITGTGDYTGTATGTFTILRKRVDLQVSLQENLFSYDGAEHKPGSTGQPLVSVWWRDSEGRKHVLPTTGYELSYSGNCVDAGVYEVTATLLGDYEGTGKAEFTIDPAEQELSVTPATLTLEEGAGESLSVQAQGALSYASSDEAVAVVSESGKVVAVSAGSATITVTAAATKNYQAASIEIPLTVTKKADDPTPGPDDPTPGPDDPTPANLSGAQLTLAQESFVYDGTAHEPEVTVELGGTPLVAGTDYTVAYVDNTNAGTATVTVTGTGAYEGTATATFTIAKATPVITAANKRVVATGTIGLGARVSEGAGELSYTTSNRRVATVTATGTVRGVAFGAATITISCAESDNYEAASKTVWVTVSRAPNTMTAKASKAKVTVKAKTVAKKKVTLKSNIKISKRKTTVSYVNASKKAVAKRIKINAKNGKITVAKGTKKGTYTVKVKVVAAATGTYAKVTRTVTFKVVVK